MWHESLILVFRQSPAAAANVTAHDIARRAYHAILHHKGSDFGLPTAKRLIVRELRAVTPRQ